MRILLDTSIVVQGELSPMEYCKVRRLYRWIDILGARRVIHPVTVERIVPRNWDYIVLPNTKPGGRFSIDKSAPHFSALLSGRADVFVTEDGISRSAAGQFGLERRVFSIEQFIRKAAATALGAKNTSELPITCERFCNLDVSEMFFDSLRNDYPGFEHWFERKSQSDAYIGRDYDGEMLGFLYLKPEDEHERYDDITPAFVSARRLKIGTFKVSCAGLGLGSRFMRIALDEAEKHGAQQIYTTLFSGRQELYSLEAFLQRNGFMRYGFKAGTRGNETVMLRQISGTRLNEN